MKSYMNDFLLSVVNGQSHLKLPGRVAGNTAPALQPGGPWETCAQASVVTSYLMASYFSERDEAYGLPNMGAMRSRLEISVSQTH